MTKKEAKAIIADTEMGDFLSLEWCRLVTEAGNVLMKNAKEDSED